MGQAQVPSIPARYFRERAARLGIRYGDREHPLVVRVFRPTVGWRRYPIRKRVSGAWARKARAEGITEVQLGANGAMGDFTLKELLR